MLNPERLEMLRKTGASDGLYHGFKGGQTTQVEKVDSIEKMAEGDGKLKEFTVNKIKELAKGNQPFFLEHAFMKVHADTFASKAFEGKSASKYPYKDSVVEVDAYIGEIVQGAGRRRRAGKHLHLRHVRQRPQMDSWPDSGYTPFRGAKASSWEGGVRVPGIAYWKGTISPGRESDELFDLMDLFNTSLDLAGASNKIPTDRYIDGIDQTSFLLEDDGSLEAREGLHLERAQSDGDAHV